MWKKSKICKVRRNAPRDFLHFGKVKRRVEERAREAQGGGARTPESEHFFRASERAAHHADRSPEAPSTSEQ